MTRDCAYTELGLADGAVHLQASWAASEPPSVYKRRGGTCPCSRMFAAAALSCGICLLDGLILLGCGDQSGKVRVGVRCMHWLLCFSCTGQKPGPAEPRFSPSSSSAWLPSWLCLQVLSLHPPGSDILQQVPGERFSWQRPHQPLARCPLWTSSG